MFAIFAMVACSSAHRSFSSYMVPVSVSSSHVAGSHADALPKAVIYKTSGDFNDNVAVTLDASGKALVSYPAPSDVSASSCPVPLRNGWLLDRRGAIGAHTAFLDCTYARYAAMPSAPSQSEIMNCIIPGAMVTRYIVLPVSANAALADPGLCDMYIPED